jgi:hypothetical protein
MGGQHSHRWLPLRALSLNSAGAATGFRAALNAVLNAALSWSPVRQTAALTAKNAIVLWRSRRATALRLAAPVVFLLLALLVDRSLDANTGLQTRYAAATSVQPAPMLPVPPCMDDLYMPPGRACLDFVYSPDGDEDVQRVVAAVMASNQPPIPHERVRGFPSREAADEWLVAHPDSALGGVHFTTRPGAAAPGLAFSVQSNSTVKYFKGTFQDPTMFFALPLQSAVAAALAREAVAAALESGSGPDALNPAGELEWAPRLAPFPHPGLPSSDLLGQVLASFIFASLMFGFVAQVCVCVRGGIAMAKAGQGGMRGGQCARAYKCHLGFTHIYTHILMYVCVCVCTPANTCTSLPFRCRHLLVSGRLGWCCLCATWA